MASVSSAGILLYRRAGTQLEVLLVHPGGPYWRGKDEPFAERRQSGGGGSNSALPI